MTRRSAVGAFGGALLGTSRLKAAERPDDVYDARNKLLSTPAAQPYATPYFTNNETGAERFYSRFENVGGVMAGVGFEQNFTYLVHGRPDIYVFFDINPDVTEILVPFFGRLMEQAASRREFLAALIGVPVSERDVRRLLEPRPQGPGEALGQYLPGVVSSLLDRAPRDSRRRNFESRLAPILDRRRIPESHRREALGWFGLLEEDMLAGGRFFAGSAAAWWTSGGNAARCRDVAGWLSTEPNYRMVRRYWRESRIVGVTGDIGGTSVEKLARWLRERGGAQVTFLYLSNVGASVQGHQAPAYFAQLYRTLGLLPLAPTAWTLIAQGSNVAYLRTYARAAAFYDSLQQLSTEAMSRLVELPLSHAVLGTRDDAIRKFEEQARTMRPGDEMNRARAILLDELDSITR